MKSQFSQKNTKTHQCHRSPLSPDWQLDAQGNNRATGIGGRNTPQTHSAGCFGALRARLCGKRTIRLSITLVAAFATAMAFMGAVKANQEKVPSVQLAQSSPIDEMKGSNDESSTILLNLQCITRESMLLGIPSSGGKDPVLRFSLDVAANGRVYVNGLPFEAEALHFSNSGELLLSGISVIRVGVATHGAVSKGMMMPDVSEEQVAQIAEIQSGIYAMMLGGRNRVMIILIEAEQVMLIDVAGEVHTNRFSVDCE